MKQLFYISNSDRASQSLIKTGCIWPRAGGFVGPTKATNFSGSSIFEKVKQLIVFFVVWRLQETNKNPDPLRLHLTLILQIQNLKQLLAPARFEEPKRIPRAAEKPPKRIPRDSKRIPRDSQESKMIPK